MKASTSSVDPVPQSAYPSLQQVTTSPPSMPKAWTATVLLHPFSPPLSTDPKPDNPFFQLCVASIVCGSGPKHADAVHLQPRRYGFARGAAHGSCALGGQSSARQRHRLLINFYSSGSSSCVGGSQFPFPQEPPNWISIPAVEGTIQATITNNPVVAPNTIVTIVSVLFPPAPPNYPEATYLWTWYAPQNTTGTQSRPITFMQSQSGVGVGTSLALADYYYYQNFQQPIDPSNFDIPASCGTQTRKIGLRRRLP